MGNIVATFGTFDLFHFGHLRIIERASDLASKLIVGVSSDSLNISKKGFQPIYSQDDRMAIVRSIRYVDHVFLEESLELKAEYLNKYSVNELVMGNDWVGRFDSLLDEVPTLHRVTYLDRTADVSTSNLIERILKERQS